MGQTLTRRLSNFIRDALKKSGELLEAIGRIDFPSGREGLDDAFELRRWMGEVLSDPAAESPIEPEKSRKEKFLGVAMGLLVLASIFWSWFDVFKDF